MDKDNARKTRGVPKRRPVPAAQASTPPSTRHTTPHVFLAGITLAAFWYAWPLRWVISGAPLLFYSFLLGEANGYRVLPGVPLWAIFSAINLTYAICSTSWLLYAWFATFCYPAVVLSCLYQFRSTADFARRTFRKFLKNLHFINDQVAFFDLPGLEIDGDDASGLMVIRGATFSLSSLTFVAHGCEVGIKLTNDMELAIQVDKVTVRLFRSIYIDDVYANVKGGDWEMTFGTIPPKTADSDTEDDSFIVSDTPILRSATAGRGSTSSSASSMKSVRSRSKPVVKMTETDDPFDGVVQLSPDEKSASDRYKEMLRDIADTSIIGAAIAELKERAENGEDGHHLDFDNDNDVRAATCTHMHEQPSVPHPPSKVVRVSTLKKNNHPKFKAWLHRFPLLYRMMLNPICYLHPVTIKSVTAAGSGKWFRYLMQQYMFKHYATSDPEIRKLEARIAHWLEDANFAVEFAPIKAIAQFPINTNFDINCNFKIGDFMAYRTLPDAVDLTQVVRVGGADATLTIPVFLFPHHEHLMPSRPTEKDEMDMETRIAEAEGTPQAVQAQTALEQMRKDEANINISAHAHLPARFHQDLLNFIAAIVKASKVIDTDHTLEELRLSRELRRSTMPSDGSSDVVSIKSETAVEDLNPERKSIRGFLKKVDTGFKEAGTRTMEGMRKAGISTAQAMANDRWIAKLVGKVCRKLEKAQGDVGYSGNFPVSLQEYREKAETLTKILP